jgi:hypothetical protein
LYHATHWKTARSGIANVVLVHAAGATGSFGPVDELPAALVAAGLGQVVVGQRVVDHEGLLCRLFARLGPHRAGIGNWAVGAPDSVGEVRLW